LNPRAMLSREGARSPRSRPRRRARRGNALLEFVLTLPIIVFVAGLTMVMANALLARQQAIVEARHHLWAAVNNGGWTPMNLEGWLPAQVPPADDAGAMPRGEGEELSRLKPEVEPPTLQTTSDGLAREYWQRIWGNLPGRHHAHQDGSFERAKMWAFIDPTVSADHYRDSSSWHFFHLDIWRIARSGPCKEIFDAFHDHLTGTVAPHFRPTRDEIIKRMWHGGDILDQDAAVGSDGKAGDFIVVPASGG
jgi:hypothetical protein